MKVAVLLLVALACVAFGGKPALDPKEKKREAKAFEGVEPSLLGAAKAVVRDDESGARERALRAVKRIRARRAALRARRAACLAKPTLAKRDDCLIDLRKDLRRSRAELLLVQKLVECSNGKSREERKKCVAKVAKKFIALKPNLARIRERRFKATEDIHVAAKVAPKNAVKAISKEKQAVQELYKLLAVERKMAANCKKVESRKNYANCRRALKKRIAATKKARKLARQLKACLKKKNVAKCTRRVENAIYLLLNPPTKKTAPGNVKQLVKAEVSERTSMLKKLLELRERYDACESSICRLNIRNTVKALHARYRGVAKKYTPRAQCLLKRRKWRKRIFRMRSYEHGVLAQLHAQGVKCRTHKCSDRVHQKRLEVEAKIKNHRKRLGKVWASLKCPLILKGGPVRPVEKPARTPDHSYGSPQSLKAMRKLLTKLARDYDACVTGECKDKLTKRIKDLNKSIKFLEKLSKQKLSQRRETDQKRNRLHSMLQRFYSLAADCASRKCRRHFRRQIKRVLKELRRLDRNDLGEVKDSVRSVNRFYRMLRAALAKCPKDSIGDACRRKVVKSFRHGTEDRQKALVMHLRRETRLAAIRAASVCRNANSKDAKKLSACLADAKKTESQRLAKLELRVLRIEKRRALRECDSTKDAKKCKDEVEKEFQRDAKLSGSASDKVAEIDVNGKKKEDSGKARSNAGSSLVAGVVAILLVALLA